MQYTKEQLKAAYALNLCTVSISQIIDYNDINIMEQEYEAILNNLNLEEIPKDEALLKILKQILDTITYFRIEEGDKKFIDKEYQHKMKNAIWAAVPNIGMVVAGGDPVTMAVSLASQIGIGYMNYRKEKANNDLEYEKQLWELEKTAIEQFNGLRRELFDTAWRLADVYKFPDQLRLTERQIKQYNNILMDTDLLRKYARLDTVKDSFMAYPPFWYYFGNVANAISRSELYLSDETRKIYADHAKEYFLQFRKINGYGLLREDEVSASCALELVDLLDINQDKELISELLDEAVRTSGRANDVMQLAAITYLKLNDRKSAGRLLNQLVNEQYNTILNAQLLSSIYVYEYIENKDSNILSKYEILNIQVGDCYLYPLPDNESADIKVLESAFIQMQKQVLLKNYLAVARCFFEKNMIKFGKIIPVPEEGKIYSDSYFRAEEVSIKERKYQISKVFADKNKAREYVYRLQERGLDFALIDLLNEMFEESCKLDFMNEAVQDRLARHIQCAVEENRDIINELMSHLECEQFDLFDAEKLIDLNFICFSHKYIEAYIDEINHYIATRREMQDFAIAEDNLAEFCIEEDLPEPNEILGEYECDSISDEKMHERRFSRNLLLGIEEPIAKENDTTDEIEEVIQNRISYIVKAEDVEFYCKGDPRIERYFRDNKKLKKNNTLMANVVAILDDKSQKGDYDLIFTKEGVVPVKNGIVKSMKLYNEISYSEGKNTALMIEGKYDNKAVDLFNLYQLIENLSKYSNGKTNKEHKNKAFDFVNHLKK